MRTTSRPPVEITAPERATLWGHPSPAVVCGCGATLEADMLRVPPGAAVIACNRAGLRLACQPDFWAVWDVEDLDAMRRQGCPTPRVATISQFDRPGVRQVRAEVSGGSVALYGAMAALALGFSRVLIAGAPLESPAYRMFRAGWRRAARLSQDFATKVRGLSGYPAELLGQPDSAWLAEG